MSNDMHEMGMQALKCLKEAVVKELRRKALYGYDAIINRNGKPCRISAIEALKITEGK